MKIKIKREEIINIIIIIFVIALALILINLPEKNVEKDLAKCIGENSELYIQLGCHACEYQKELFGSNYEYLNITDCYYEPEKCLEIPYTPTWIINNQEYVGAKAIEELKNITNC
jgi:hypothetical protein